MRIWSQLKCFFITINIDIYISTKTRAIICNHWIKDIITSLDLAIIIIKLAYKCDISIYISRSSQFV